MRRALNMLLSLGLILLFSYVTSYYPNYTSLFFILYIVATLLVTVAIAGRGAVRVVQDLEYVRAGEKILHVGRDVVERLRSRDRELRSELSSQQKAYAMQILVLIVIFSIIALPGLRDQVLGVLRALISTLGLEAKLTEFLVFLVLYLAFFSISSIMNFVVSRNIEKSGGPIQIPVFYTVTSRGLILEGRTPLRAPLKPTEIRVNTRRRFLELRVRAPTPGARAPTSRIRLYYENPRRLEEHLRKLTEESR